MLPSLADTTFVFYLMQTTNNVDAIYSSRGNATYYLKFSHQFNVNKTKPVVTADRLAQFGGVSMMSRCQGQIELAYWLPA